MTILYHTIHVNISYYFLNVLVNDHWNDSLWDDKVSVRYKKWSFVSVHNWYNVIYILYFRTIIESVYKIEFYTIEVWPLEYASLMFVT